jgi:hypothetical protein
MLTEGTVEPEIAEVMGRLHTGSGKCGRSDTFQSSLHNI